MESKTELRRHIRQLKASLTQTEKQRQADSVFHDIECTKQFKVAKVVLLYHSLPDELPTHLVIDQWSKAKTILLPRVDGENLRLFEYNASAMVQGSFNIAEPSASCKEYTIADVDLAIVPAMAFDNKGHRLGRGKGFYDRLLANSPVTKIGVAFSTQILKTVPADAFDVGMDIVITDKSVFFTNH